MNMFTLRLEDDLAKKLDRICRKKGYKKNGLIKSLIKDFIEKEGRDSVELKSPAKLFSSLVGIVSIGGDAVEDCENLYDE